MKLSALKVPQKLKMSIGATPRANMPRPMSNIATTTTPSAACGVLKR